MIINNNNLTDNGPNAWFISVPQLFRHAVVQSKFANQPFVLSLMYQHVCAAYSHWEVPFYFLLKCLPFWHQREHGLKWWYVVSLCTDKGWLQRETPNRCSFENNLNIFPKSYQEIIRKLYGSPHALRITIRKTKSYCTFLGHQLHVRLRKCCAVHWRVAEGASASLARTSASHPWNSCEAALWDATEKN